MKSTQLLQILLLNPFWLRYWHSNLSHNFRKCCRSVHSDLHHTRIDAVVRVLTLLYNKSQRFLSDIQAIIIVFSKSKSENSHRERTPFPVSFHWFFVGFYLVPAMSERQFPSGKHLFYYLIFMQKVALCCWPCYYSSSCRKFCSWVTPTDSSKDRTNIDKKNLTSSRVSCSKLGNYSNSLI